MYLFLSLPIFLLNGIFAYRAKRRLVEARSFSKYPYRIDVILLMLMFSLPSSFGTFVLDLFSFTKTPSSSGCLLFAISHRLNTLGSILLVGILVYLISVFSNRVGPKALEWFGFIFLITTTVLGFTMILSRLVSRSGILVYSKEFGSVDYCFFKSSYLDVFFWNLAHVNISVSFTLSIFLFVYENCFHKTKDEPKRNNIIFSYFLMGLNQVTVYMIIFLIKTPSNILQKNVVHNVVFDVLHLRTFFLSLIVLHFEGPARINLDAYPIGRILRTKELSDLFKTYTKRVKHKKLYYLVLHWEKLQTEKSNKTDSSFEEKRAFENKEKKIIKALELEGFYGFILSNEFLNYALKMERAGKSELDIN